MKTVSIVRHAKADKPEGYPSDYERPLTPRGHKDAENIAAVLARLTPPVDCLLSSPAARAAQTSDYLAAVLGETQPVQWNESIYLATAETLLEILKQLPDELNHVVLVGHNPGMERLVSGLCGGSPDNNVIAMPTAALAHLTVDITRWSQLRWGIGELRLLLPPKIVRL